MLARLARLARRALAPASLLALALLPAACERHDRLASEVALSERPTVIRLDPPRRATGPMRELCLEVGQGAADQIAGRRVRIDVVLVDTAGRREILGDTIRADISRAGPETVCLQDRGLAIDYPWHVSHCRQQSDWPERRCDIPEDSVRALEEAYRKAPKVRTAVYRAVELRASAPVLARRVTWWAGQRSASL